MRAAYLHENRQRFGAYNVRVIEGTVPQALTDEPHRPRLVFIGGSGRHLPEVLDLVGKRLRDDGRLVANFVTLEHLGLMLNWLRQVGWHHETVELHVARSDALAGLTGLRPQRSVFMVCAERRHGASRNA
jgi:precorrin-6B methylase 2